MATLSELRKMKASPKWNDPVYRWRFGQKVNERIEAGDSYRSIAERLDTSEGTIRHAAKLASQLRRSEVAKLAGRPWRSTLDLRRAKTRSEALKILSAITDPSMNSNEARKQLRKQSRQKRSVRFRGELAEEMIERAEVFAAAAEQFKRQFSDEQFTKGQQRKIAKALKAAEDAGKAARRAMG